MLPWLRAALVAALLLFSPAISAARSSSGGSHHSYSSGGSTHVRGYTRKDGTYVRPHERRDSAPHAYSTPRSGSGRSSTRSRSYESYRRDWSSQGRRRESASPSPDYYGLRRDSHGRIERSEAAKREFERRNPCPSTGRTSGPCPGYVIDHIQALKHGGADAPGNMQWQTIEAAKAKDRWE